MINNRQLRLSPRMHTRLVQTLESHYRSTRDPDVRKLLHIVRCAKYIQCQPLDSPPPPEPEHEHASSSRSTVAPSPSSTAAPTSPTPSDGSSMPATASAPASSRATSTPRPAARFALPLGEELERPAERINPPSYETRARAPKEP